MSWFNAGLLFFSILFILFTIALVLTLIDEARQLEENIISFCKENGFTDFQNNFCYKEVNGHIEKQGFFITKQGRILVMNE